MHAQLDPADSLHIRGPAVDAPSFLATQDGLEETQITTRNADALAYPFINEDDKLISSKPELTTRSVLEPCVEEDPCQVVQGLQPKAWGRCNVAACAAHPLARCARSPPHYIKCRPSGWNLPETRNICNNCRCKERPEYKGMGPGLPRRKGGKQRGIDGPRVSSFRPRLSRRENIFDISRKSLVNMYLGS